MNLPSLGPWIGQSRCICLNPANRAETLQIAQLTRERDALKRELKLIGGRMTGEWLRQAGPDGQAIIDAYRK